MPRWFEFYEGDFYHECRITKGGYYMHRWGICSQHVMMSWHRITENEYIEFYNRKMGY